MSIFRSATVLVAAGLLTAACQAAAGTTGTTTATTYAPLAPAVTSPPAAASAPATTTTSETTTVPPATATTTTVAVPVSDCTVVQTGSDGDFYRKECEQNGIAIVAAASVDDAALETAADRMAGLFAHRPELADVVAASIDHVAIIGRDQRITALPDFSDLYFVLPGTDWNRLGRSFPGSDEVPVAAGAEENLLCLDEDRYRGEDMFLRDFGWSIRRFGLAAVEPSLDRAIEDAYGRAIAAGLWKHTIAEVNSDQYWAEGVESFFDANNEAESDKDETHNDIDTRDELRDYDPGLFEILVDVFGATEWRPECPTE